MGHNGEQLYLSEVADHLSPSIGLDGQWSSAGALALRQSLRFGSLDSAMDLLMAMPAKAIAATLREAGFLVPDTVIKASRETVLETVLHELIAALELRVDGFALHDGRGIPFAQASGSSQSFATKEMPEKIPMRFDATNFAGDYGAAMTIQKVLSAESVSLSLLGDAPGGDRASMQMLAGAALDKGVQGFGFDGIPGKYEVLLSMGAVAHLHRDAARAVAEESVRSALASWVKGGRITDISALVPDSIQRMVYGSASMETVLLVIHAIEAGTIGAHAADIGGQDFAQLLAEQGFDVNAITIRDQAKKLGLQVVDTDRSRGQYIGPVVGLDHRAALVKFNRSGAVELPFEALGPEQDRPKQGDLVRVGFTQGAMVVTVAERAARKSVAR